MGLRLAMPLCFWSLRSSLWMPLLFHSLKHVPQGLCCFMGFGLATHSVIGLGLQTLRVT